MIVYKAVSTFYGKYTSATSDDSGLGLTYEIGKTTIPLIGLIFAFRSLPLARRWGGGAILKCKTPEIQPLRVRTWSDNPEEQVAYWLGEDTESFQVPIGTVGCPELTPIRVVY